MRKLQESSIALALLAAMLMTATTNARAQAKPTAPASAAKPSASPLKGLRAERDDMRGITWYQHPSSPKHANSNGFYVYFGKEDSGSFTALRLVARYYADSWLFVSRAWAKADGVTVDVPQKADKLFGWERDNGAGGIWEWSDTPVVTSSDIAAVRTLANAKNVTVRFERQTVLQRPQALCPAAQGSARGHHGVRGRDRQALEVGLLFARHG